jgi:hypothetical protein
MMNLAGQALKPDVDAAGAGKASIRSFQEVLIMQFLIQQFLLTVRQS